MSDSGAGVESQKSQGSAALTALAALIVLLCLLAYGPGLNGPLFFDDVPNLLSNDLVKIDGAELDDWRVAALSSSAGYFYRPVAMLTFGLNHALAGSFSAFQLKATNLGIHIAIGALVYLFAHAVLQSPAQRASGLSTTQRRFAAAIAAAIWLLHPIHVSTVLYAVQRMAQLSTLFTLAGLLVFMRYRLRWAESGAGPGEVLAALLWLVLLSILALLSKENGALLPWLVAVVEVTLFRGIWRGESRVPLVRLGWCALLLPLLMLMLVVVFSPELVSGRFGGREFTLEDRLLTQARALWRYIGWLAVPNILDMGFFHDDIPISRSLWSPVTTLLSLVAWIAVLAIALLGRRRYSLAWFALLFYLVAHSMESSVLPLEMVFEHRNYLPSVGLAVLAAVWMVRISARYHASRPYLLPAGVVVLLVALLALRAQAWRDEVSLARFEVVNHPQSARANFLYANALYRRFQRAEALGLDEEEQRALAVTSRQYFERMHRLNEREFAALVMLHQLDTLYFPGLVEDSDWLGVMAKLAETRRLQSSDRTALGALVEFSLTPAGASTRPRVEALVEQLMLRYPTRLDLVGMKYRIAIAEGKANEAELLPVLERAARLNPGSRHAAAYLAQYHDARDVDATYAALREWLRRDVERRELHVIKRIFDK
jgi:hypothetical protein